MPERKSVAASYDYCRTLARTAARNFYYGFRSAAAGEARRALRPLRLHARSGRHLRRPGEIDREAARPRRAPCRNGSRCSPESHRHRPDLACVSSIPLERYHIPSRYLHDLISGAEMDLTVSVYETFDRLREYCYRVAGTVWSLLRSRFRLQRSQRPGTGRSASASPFRSPTFFATSPKISPWAASICRSTIWRDFIATPAICRQPKAAAHFADLIRFQAERAWQLYSEGWRLLDLVEEDSRAALWAMARIYSGILEKIEQRRYDVLSPPPARLSSAEKVWILARARLGWRDPHYVQRMCERDRRGTGGTLGGRRAG